MRDKRFVAEHRGGPLKKDQHRQLIRWARECAEHVLPLLPESPDDRLKHALTVARQWEDGNASVGDARNASCGAIAVANEQKDPACVAFARSIGHVVATAHMADHAPGSADYALRVVKNAGGPFDAERQWQDDQLPPEIRELVISARSLRSLKI
jgi:hypothetical protein